MYQPPSVNEIVADLREATRAEVQGTDPWIWPNNLVPILKAFAQALRAAYLRLAYIHEQAFVSTARGEYLDYHGIQTGGLARNPARFASGQVNVDAVLGTVIPDNTVLVRADGQQFYTVGTRTITSLPASVLIRAVNAGELGNTDYGAYLNLLAPITGANLFTVGTAGLLGGAEEETDDSFRQRILFVKQNPPHGGSPAEYIQWTQTKSGVTRVFVQRATPQPGSVTVYFMMDGIGTGIPTPTAVNQVQTILNQLAPGDADVIVAAPALQAINVVVTGLQPNTADMRSKVIEELKAMFLRRAEPASAIQSFTWSKAWLDEAIAMAPKIKRWTVTTPSADVVVSTAGNIPALGTVTFT